MEDIPRSNFKQKEFWLKNSISDCADVHSECSRCNAIYFLS